MRREAPSSGTNGRAEATRTIEGAGAGAQGRNQLPVVGAFERSAADIFDPHPRDAMAFEFEQLGGLVRDVNEAVAVIGPAVVDPTSGRRRGIGKRFVDQRLRGFAGI